MAGFLCCVLPGVSVRTARQDGGYVKSGPMRVRGALRIRRERGTRARRSHIVRSDEITRTPAGLIINPADILSDYPKRDQLGCPQEQHNHHQRRPSFHGPPSDQLTKYVDKIEE